MAFITSRRLTVRGRPPDLGGGSRGSKISHSWSVKSLGYRFSSMGYPSPSTLPPIYDNPSQTSSKALAEHVPSEDAYAVSRCKEAGAIILGKENLEEFAAGSTSTNLHYGAVH